jgi:hypothetical protein
MREPIIETFTIPATYNDFRNWITSYGLFKHEFITEDMQYQPGVFTWWHHLKKGSAIFRTKIEQPELLTVTAELVTRYLADDDGIERWILDEEPILVENFKELVEAIRTKYPQATHSEILSPTFPPWDKLANKRRWTDSDWIYFFDYEVEAKKSKNLNSTPNFKTLSDRIFEHTNEVKTADYINKKYYTTYIPHKDGSK